MENYLNYKFDEAFIIAIQKQGDRVTLEIITNMKEGGIPDPIIQQVAEVLRSTNQSRVQYETLREQLKVRESNILRMEMRLEERR